MIVRPGILIATLLAAPLVAPAPAFAQRNAYQAEGEVGRLLDDARSYYDNLELEAAEDALNRAIRLSEQYGIRSPVLAEIYIQRGILVHVRDKDAGRAVADFVEALLVDERARLDPLVSTPSLERLFEEAREEARRRGPARRDPPREAPRAADDLRHTPIPRARGGENLTVTAEVSDAINPHVYRVYLYFRSARSDQVQQIEMRPDGRRGFSARIPGRFVAGRTLSYYILAEDRSGRIIANVHSAKDPLVVEIRGDRFGEEIPSGSSLVGGDEWEEDDGSVRRYVTVALSIGSGAGFITERAEPQNTKSADIRPGFAVAPFHTLLELDFWATEWLGLGAYARLQIVEFAHLEGGRLKFKVIDDGPHELQLRAGGGVGRVRHLVDLGDVKDTTLEGPYHYTLGASYLYEFNDLFALVISPDFLHLIGDSPSQHIDLSIGCQVGF